MRQIISSFKKRYSHEEVLGAVFFSPVEIAVNF